MTTRKHCENFDPRYSDTTSNPVVVHLGVESIEEQRRYSPPKVMSNMTLKETPAMASGLEDRVWMIRELIEESAKF